MYLQLFAASHCRQKQACKAVNAIPKAAWSTWSLLSSIGLSCIELQQDALCGGEGRGGGSLYLSRRSIQGGEVQLIISGTQMSKKVKKVTLHLIALLLCYRWAIYLAQKALSD